jgi:hypothetical protein
MTSALTCFGSHLNHNQGANLCLTKNYSCGYMLLLFMIRSMFWQYIGLICGYLVRCDVEFPASQRTR